MIIDKFGTIRNSEKFMCYSFGDEMHYIQGFFYVPGYLCGEESAEQIYRALKEDGEIPFERMYGSYTYCIVRATGEKYFFACNAALSCLYISQHATSSSYKEHLSFLKNECIGLNFNKEALCDYLTLGNTYFGDTFVNEISILSNSAYVYWGNDGMQVLDKQIENVDGKSNLSSPYEFFEMLAHAASNQNCSLSLTGGYDSRAIFAQIYKKLKLKVFLSTNSESHPDLLVAKKVASAVEMPLEVYYTKKPDLSEELIRNTIYKIDCLQTPVDCTRKINFRKELQKCGCTLQFTGDGGVLHKDWEWMQDLPFYHKKKTNLRRFYKQRVAFAPSTSYLGSEITELYREQEQRFVNKMQQYVRKINTQSYDMLYYYVNGDRRILYSLDEMQYVAYAPFVELDFVRYSYHLPRRKRFYYNFLREITTNGSAEVARIPTNYRMTASNEARYLVRDVAIQLMDYGIKACRMVGRKLFRKSFFVPKLIDWDLKKDLQQLSISQTALNWAISKNLSAPSATVENLSYDQLLRLIHIYILAVDFLIQ